jgi:hypothetical protein
MLDQPAPDFELPATGNTTFRLRDARGKNLVLYFYPKDNTPGCTAEGQRFRDLHGEFARAGCAVYGVSRDVLEWIPPNEAFGFDQLMHALLAGSHRVRVCPHAGFWLDIGRPDDYQEVCEQWPRLAQRLLPRCLAS